MQLNKEQQEACDHINGPLAVLAGAGSGKTSVVVNRVAKLIASGVPPYKILAVTFTNKAAGELKERLLKMELTPPLTVTFHALGVRILRESIHHFGYQNDFTIFDAADSLSLVKLLIQEITGKKEVKVAKRLKKLISDAKRKMIPPGGSLSELLFDTEAEKSLFAEVYQRYIQRCMASNAVDFDDLILLTVKILQDNDLREKYADRWEYLLVDEYQDTNHPQYLICKALCSKHNNLFVVGDPDQSIYSFRGAKISNILNFEKDFPGAKVIALQQNYRSTNHILSAANHVIEKNNRLYEKNLFSDNGDGERVGLHRFNNGFDEVRFVVRKVESYLRAGIDLSEMVVFYRTNSQSRMFEDGLIEAGIPYQIIGGLSFYQRKEIKDLLAYLRVLVSPSDFVSFTRIINLPKRGIGKKSVEKIIAAAMEEKISVIECCRKLLMGEGTFKLTPKASNGLADFMQYYDKMKQFLSEGMDLSEVITESFSLSRYGEVLKEDRDSLQDRLENIDELVSKADNYQKERSNELSSFLEDVCLDVDSAEEIETYSKLSLMTIHNAKGLEFTACFVVGLEEDVFPHVRSKNSIEEIEEERRLFYVGMTRAKRFLHLTMAKRRFLWGSEKIMKESRFLLELPSAHVEGASSLVHPPSVEGEIRPGSYVYHKTFGKGVVDKVYETSYGVTYDVLFAIDNEKRTLVAKFAKLALV
ncbi:ATP-dependent helicase [bacterium]|nr:ATP-dependent helicase [bacterium]